VEEKKMPRPIPALQADIDKLNAMRISEDVIIGSYLDSLIDETISRLESQLVELQENREERRAERHAALDASQDKVDAMLLDPNLSQYVQRRLARFKIRLERHREAI
jgi:hypothetical protein